MPIMTPFEGFEAVLGFLSVVLLPILVMLVRFTVKFTRAEAKLNNVADKMVEHITGEATLHAEIAVQMREDRKATDERLRWLERNLWQRQGNRSVS